jgi:3-deoxy-D-manno-octulosonate 8-phosphate phosphatase (KDO 8-P phosphatase)
MDARQRASRVRLMAFDIDGVMTDGGLTYTDDGREQLRALGFTV